MSGLLKARVIQNELLSVTITFIWSVTYYKKQWSSWRPNPSQWTTKSSRMNNTEWIHYPPLNRVYPKEKSTWRLKLQFDCIFRLRIDQIFNVGQPTLTWEGHKEWDSWMDVKIGRSNEKLLTQWMFWVYSLYFCVSDRVLLTISRSL